MKKKLNFWLIFGVVYIALWIGMAIGSVGTIADADTIGWELPIAMLLLLGSTFVFGIFAALEDRK